MRPMSTPDDLAAENLLRRIDHLVYATPDLEATLADVEHRLGTRPSEGGRHPGRGTRNFLVAIGPSSYLEILGPDRDQPEPAGPRWLRIDELSEARLVRWAANGADLPTLASEAARKGVDLGAVTSGARTRPDGVALSWRYTDPLTIVEGCVVPFFIDWGVSPHPAGTSAPGPPIVDLRAEHPDPAHARRTLQALGLPLAVSRGAEPALIATFRTATGDVELR